MSAAPGSRERFDMRSLKSLGVPVTRIENDSRRIRSGDVFVAYPGESRDGRDFIAQAVQAGASAVLWERDGYAWRHEHAVPNLAITGLRDTVGEIAASLHGAPANALWMIGVTGTNGKTSCSHWIAAALTAAGRRPAIIGTLGHGFPGALTELANTTPDSLQLHALLATYRDAGADCVSMEVSSHGLAQGRLSGARFDVALFTNLTRDHLDYHGDMVDYGEAKAKLFEWPGLRSAVINVDDMFGQSLARRIAGREVNVLTYGLTSGAIAAHKLDLTQFGLSLEIRSPWGSGVVRSRLMGEFNAANLLGVLGVLLASDVPLDEALTCLERLEAVPGRMQTIGGGDMPVVVVDYAHTPDALEKVLLALRAHRARGRLICVFGCGGDRDPGKRPLMGAIATRFADQVVITSDNPRGEEPRSIIAQITSGARLPYVTEPDRAHAIELAIDSANAGDVVLIAGKGHEPYQEIAGVRQPFSDIAVGKACLLAWRARHGPAATGAHA